MRPPAGLAVDRSHVQNTPLYGPRDRCRMAGGRLISPHVGWIGLGLAGPLAVAAHAHV